MVGLKNGKRKINNMSSIRSIKTEMNPIKIEIPVTPILVEDLNVGGFTSYFKEFPEICSQGENMTLALRNLTNTVFDVFKHKNTLPE
jgi:predicted RNase H-like HicB family nuclease